MRYGVYAILPASSQDYEGKSSGVGLQYETEEGVNVSFVLKLAGVF
jgi:hypothetical protein